MTDPPADSTDRRGAVARLAEALAAAQAAARDEPLEDDRSLEDDQSLESDGLSESRDRSPSVPETADVERTEAAGPDVEAGAGVLRDRIDALPTVDRRDDGRDDGPGVDGADASTPPVDGSAPVSEPPGHGRRSRTKGTATRRVWPLYVVMVVLILAVPALAFVGYRVASNSTAGDVLKGRSKPTAPGYTALVEPTPVLLVMHVSDSGTPIGITLLSLSGPNQRGGTVLVAPTETRLRTTSLGFRTLSQVVTLGRPVTAGRVIGSTLGLGFTDVVKVTDADIARLVEPVAPLRIDNPDAVTTASGETIPSGSVDLDASQVAAYLGAADEGKTISGRLSRQQLVWQAWIAAIARSRSAAAVPGESDSGIGRYLRSLAGGKVQTASFPWNPAADLNGAPTVTVDRGPAMLLIANAVPFPVAANAGERAVVAVLNGTGPESAPLSVIQRLTFAGAQITTVGNADRFDTARTTVTYNVPGSKSFAQAMVRELGAGRVVQGRAADSGIDVVVILGRDIMSNPPAPLTAEDVEGNR